MNRTTFLSLIFAATAIVACFLPWFDIESNHIVLTGMHTEGTKFGKPGLLHIVLSVIYLGFALVPKSWGQRANLLVIAVNTAWCIRNYFMLSTCYGGECPVTQYGFYLLIIGSLGMVVATLSSKR